MKICDFDVKQPGDFSPVLRLTSNVIVNGEVPGRTELRTSSSSVIDYYDSPNKYVNVILCCTGCDQVREITPLGLF